MKDLVQFYEYLKECGHSRTDHETKKTLLSIILYEALKKKFPILLLSNFKFNSTSISICSQLIPNMVNPSHSESAEVFRM